MSLISILTPINLYTTPLLNSWQQFSPSEICNHTHNRRSRHSAQAEAKVVPPLLLLIPFHSGVIPLHSRLFHSCSAQSLTPHFTKGKIRRKAKKGVLEVQGVQTPSLTLQKGGERKGEINSPKS